MYARPIEEYPAQSQQAAAIMLMIQNNLNPAVTTSARAYYLWWQWSCFPKLGAIFTDHAVFILHDQRTNPTYIQRAPNGSFPFISKCP
jgi:hypothetical protein